MLYTLVGTERMVLKVEEEEISLQKAATLAEVSASTVYYYIKKGLLRKPKHIPNIEKGRGSLAVYPKSMVDQIKFIKANLEDTHSIVQLKKKMENPNSKEDLQKRYVKITGRLLELAKEGKQEEQEFKDLGFILTSGTGPASMMEFPSHEKKIKK